MLALKPLADVHNLIRTTRDPAVRAEAKRVAHEAYLKSKGFERVDLTFLIAYLDGQLDLCALTPLSSVSSRPPYSASHEEWLWKLRRAKLEWGRIDRPGDKQRRAARLAGLVQELEEIQALAAKYRS
jgi:hypothetical protein